MKQNVFLPFLRRPKIWCAVLAALIVFLVTGALLSQAVEDSREQIDRAYDRMEIVFRLGPGRTRFGSSFSLTLFQLRELVTADWYEDMKASYTLNVNSGLKYVWTADPLGDYGEPLEGAYGSGVYCSPAMVKIFRITLGDEIGIQWYGDYENTRELRTLAAVSENIPDDTIVMSWETFERYMRDVPEYKANLVFREMTFRVRPERNRDIRDIFTFVQKTVNNTAHPADRNKFVAVYYNEAEIRGVTDPLEEKQASAVFFDRLFRALMPFVIYILELVAVLSLANEFGVPRLLGEGRMKVFLSLWLPAAVLLAAGYLAAFPILFAAGLLPYLDPGAVLLHFGGSLALTALPSALLCLIDPLTLLKERNDE